MKILLISDIPPTRALTAGLVLDRMVRLLPARSVVCFSPINPGVDAPIPDDLEIDHYLVDKPNEEGPSERSALARARGAARGVWQRSVVAPRLVDEACRFGERHGVDRVLGVLQGQTAIGMAVPVARRLKVPLHTLVWDPLSWWLQGHRADPWTARAANKAFDRAVRSSVSCATASWAMAEEYARLYGVRCEPVIASHPAELGRQPDPKLADNGELLIGMAGQFYARQEWMALVTALKAVNWVIGGRSVRFRTLGGAKPPGPIPAERLEYLGWRPQQELIQLMSECDLLYCPYPFEKSLGDVSRLSFPSKLVIYLAAGKPIIFHGPAGSSPGRYVIDHSAGMVINQPFASAVFNGLTELLRQPELMERMARNSQKAFLQDFTLERFEEHLRAFLDVGADAAPSQAAAPPEIERSDQRRSRRPTKPKASRIDQLAWAFPEVRRLRAERDELKAWQQVHIPELSGLYNYVAELDGARNAARAEAEKYKALYESLARQDA